MSLEQRWMELTEDQRQKARACQTPDEMLALAREEGYELNDEELGAIAGGSYWNCSTNVPCTSYQTCLRDDSSY